MSGTAAVSPDTIAAISTPAGEGAIALVRISGLGALPLADAIFRGKKRPSQFESHRQHLGQLLQGGRVIDQVVLSVHRAPASYTGEDLIEINCHGGMLVTAKVLEACLCAGARLAHPGEFSERAFHHGKLDLTQAEAVIDLIRAQSDLALRSATEQLGGRLGDEFRGVREQLIGILAHVEAAIDFPEEGIAPDDLATLRSRIDRLHVCVGKLLDTATTGKILREGLRVVLFGATNAGKSSLLNCLLGFERAIVHDEPGTTRDTIEETIHLRGIALRLLDTAGLRDPANTIERAGIARTRSSLSTADLRLHVVDGSVAAPPDFVANPDELQIVNKSDLAPHPDWIAANGVRLSCKTGSGLPELENAIWERIGGGRVSAESALAINARHRGDLQSAADALVRALEALDYGATPEMFAVDLHEARRALDQLLGDENEEAVRDSIFSQFCIGK